MFVLLSLYSHLYFHMDYLIVTDIFVKHAFGNYRDILAETSYHPLMAEHLSYLRSKSHSYVYEDEDKRISRYVANNSMQPLLRCKFISLTLPFLSPPTTK